MPRKTWSAGEQVNAADLNKTIQDAIGAITYDINDGESIDGTTTPVCVYISPVDGELYKTDASYTDERSQLFFGMQLDSSVNGSEARVQTGGIVTIPSVTLSSSITQKNDQYNTLNGDTSGTGFDTLNSVSKQFSIGFRTGHKTGNVKEIDLLINGLSVSGLDTYLSIYAMDSDGKPTGASLGDSGIVTAINSSNVRTYTFSTAVDVQPDTNYCAVLIIDGILGGSITVRGSNASNPVAMYGWLDMPSTVNYYSSNSGSTWVAGSGAVSPYIVTKTTNKTHSYGDSLFLSVTAGEYTLDVPDILSASVVVIGRLLSTTKFILENQRHILLGQAIIGYVVGTGVIAGKQYIHAPNRALSADISVIEVSSGLDVQDYFLKIKKGETVTYDYGSGRTYTVAWTDNMITITTDQLSDSFRSEIKFYS